MASPLGRLKLLIALDALLVEGSVTGAARSLGIGVPSMSRLLSQMRTAFGDQIVRRTGKGMVPTPFAEQLRLRIRALASEADELMRPDVGSDATAASRPQPVPLVQHPPLAVRSTPVLEGEPGARTIAQRLSSVGADAAPAERLGRYVVTVGAGAGRSRPLTTEEAEDALAIILDGDADPVQIGALLVALQYRGVTAGELAGLVRAARRGCRPLTADGPADLDWPVYLSPRNLRPPWFLLAARLLSLAGHRIALHGFGRGFGNIDQALEALGIPRCLSIDEAAAQLSAGGIAHLPLSAINPQLRALIGLYALFKMRSPLNLVMQLLNPLGAASTVVGAPSSAAQTLHRDAALLLGWRGFLAVGTYRDVAQATPARAMSVAMLDRGAPRDLVVPAARAWREKPQRTGLAAVEYCAGLWTGAVRDEQATEIVLSTAALALMTLEPLDYPAARERAAALWADRS